MEGGPLLSPETIAGIRTDLEIGEIRSLLMCAAANEWTQEQLFEVVIDGAPNTIGDILEKEVWDDGQA